jgi:cardiolipin synthase
LRKVGIPAARFHHVRLPWRMPFLNMRNHKKILLLDGRVAFTGGMNIGDDNLVGPQSCPCRRQDPRHVVRDTHFEIEGPVAAQLAEAFAEDWRTATGERLAGPEWFPPISAAGEAAARAVPSGPDEDVNQLELLLLAAIAEARQSIRIATPYFVPPERLISALRVAALRGVAIDIVLPRRADHRMMDWAARAHIRPLLSVGCRLWYAPDPFNHSKLMSVDGTWSLLGSANWDTRSLRLNFELNVEVRDPAFAQAMERMIFASREREVTGPELDAQHLAIRVRNAASRLLLPYI